MLGQLCTQLRQLQVWVLELISGPVRNSSSCEAPLLSLCLRQALTQLPEQRPPAVGKPQGTRDACQASRLVTASAGDLGFPKLAADPKASQTVLDISVQATELDPLWEPPHHTGQRCPAHSYPTLPQPAPAAQSIKQQPFSVEAQAKCKIHFWVHSIALHWGQGLNKLSSTTHSPSRPELQLTGDADPVLPQLIPRVSGGWHAPALPSKRLSERNQVLIWLMQSMTFAQ